MDSPEPTRAERLAKQILEDRQRRASERAPDAPTKCFACGRPFTYRGPQGDDSGRFCGAKCREAYDGGYPQFREPTEGFTEPLLSWLVVAGPPGMAIGSRYYEQLDATLKNQRARNERDTGKIPDGELARPPRRCAQCGGRIPVWIKGRKVPASRKLCLTCRPYTGK